jgi:hypothetical protein
MEGINKYLRNPAARKSGPNSERAELIGYFADEVNKEREGTKYGKVRYAYIATKLAHLSVPDLYAFKRQLEDYTSRGNSFSKGFFGALKPRQEV